jgi:putative copper export protein
VYDFWQFLHVTSAIVWVGAAAMALFLSVRLEAAGDPSASTANRMVESKAVPLFMVASLATLVTGLVMAFGWIGFEPLWIKIGLGGIFLSLVIGFGYFKPRIAKLDALVAERGSEDAGVRALGRQMNVVAAVELLIFLVVVWAMVTKP